MLRSLSWEVDEVRPSPMRAAHDLAAARTFYIGLLRGTLVHAGRRHTDTARLLFRVGDVLVETGAGTHLGRAPVRLHVDDPLAVAERCWDAGFSVRVIERPFGDATITVIDPFGRQIELMQSAAYSRAEASGE